MPYCLPGILKILVDLWAKLFYYVSYKEVFTSHFNNSTYLPTLIIWTN